MTVRRKRPSAVPCRKCGHEIVVPEESTVRNISHAEIFGTLSASAHAPVSREADIEPEPQEVLESSEDLAQVEVDPELVHTQDVIEDLHVPVDQSTEISEALEPPKPLQDLEILEVQGRPDLRQTEETPQLPEPHQHIEVSWDPPPDEVDPELTDDWDFSEGLAQEVADPAPPQGVLDRLSVPQDVETSASPGLKKDLEVLEGPTSREPLSFKDLATDFEKAKPPASQPLRGPESGLFRLAVVLVVLAALATTFWALSRETETRVEYIEPTPEPPEAIRQAVLTEGRAEAISKSIARLRAKSEDELYEEAETQIRANNFGAAWDLIGELLLRSPENVEYQILEIEAKLGARQFHDARMLTLRAMSRHEDSRLQKFFDQSIDSDPSLRPNIIDIATLDADTILPLGGGRSISLKLRKDGENTHVFKPAQKEWGDGWRSEVAAWRFCQIVVCEFLVPQSQTARISRKDFERLYPAQTDHQREYQARFVDLNWVNIDGPNGPEEWLYGVLKVWVPTIVDFPVEVPELWQPWLSAEADPTRLQNTLADEITPIKHLRDGEVARAILRQHNGAPVSSIARQLSNIFVFDFLTNNWDRWSEREEYFGVNNHFADGRMISLDNGAAFHTLSSSRVDQRFDSVERFSRSMVFSVRRLDPSWVDPILFEDIGLEGTEEQRLKVFWTRKTELLKRIDTLRSLHGDAKVLYFP